jgi:putative FmdB family regulatory protein
MFTHVCQACREEFEVLVSGSRRDAPQPCPLCKADTTKRIATPGSFSLKGKGWAKDGYGKGEVS